MLLMSLSDSFEHFTYSLLQGHTTTTNNILVMANNINWNGIYKMINDLFGLTLTYYFLFNQNLATRAL